MEESYKYDIPEKSPRSQGDYKRQSDLSSGITVTEYLINNYPPVLEPTIDDYGECATMVPLRSTAYFSNNINVKEEVEEAEEEAEEEEDNSIDKQIIVTQFQMDLEERKRARRRMKNKISAQESRRRKKEYVDSLEDKLKQRDQEKHLLKDKVTELEDKVQHLVNELFALKQSTTQQRASAMCSECRSRLGFEQNKKIQPKSISQISRATQTGICLHCYESGQGSIYSSSHGKYDAFDQEVPPCHPDVASSTAYHSVSKNHIRNLGSSFMYPRLEDDADVDITQVDNEENHQNSQISPPRLLITRSSSATDVMVPSSSESKNRFTKRHSSDPEVYQLPKTRMKYELSSESSCSSNNSNDMESTFKYRERSPIDEIFLENTETYSYQSTKER